MSSFGRGPATKPRGVLAGTGLTPETQKLLQDSMNQRGLSLRAMQDVANSVQGGNSSWVDALMHKTASFNPPASQTKSAVNVPKYNKGSFKPVVPDMPASFSGKRMAHQIPTPERDMWVGGAPAPDREMLKTELSKAMEHGSAAAARKHDQALAEAQRAAEEAAAHAKPVDVKEAMIDQMVAEIQERTEFLDSMKATGQLQVYETQIKGEINERMMGLKALGVDVGQSRQQRQPIMQAPWQKKQPEARR